MELTVYHLLAAVVIQLIAILAIAPCLKAEVKLHSKRTQAAQEPEPKIETQPRFHSWTKWTTLTAGKIVWPESDIETGRFVRMVCHCKDCGRFKFKTIEF